MRSGACSVQQALTAEAASVLKQSLGLARRRGHAQVTPLHVAATLLTTSSSSSLLRRACLKSQHPHGHLLQSSPHPLQCRALELCFNVALNRLPTTPPPSSSSSPLLHMPNLSLSNALIAALKRAQSHQRRGCIEQHQQQQQQQQSSFHHQQPLLAIKVELEQLIISILDDPSVSRVMREAGFSSTTVKTNLEEDNNSSSSVVLSPAPPSFFFDSHASTAFLNTRLLKPHFSYFREEDLKVVMDVMKQRRRRGNAVVVVGDSAFYAEGVVSELMGRVEGGGQACFHSIRLHLSYVHLRLMSRSEVDAKVSDLRRRVVSLASQRRPPGSGIIIYVGDLRWALDHEETKAGDDDDDDGFSAVEHLIEQVGTLLAELKTTTSSDCCNVWLMAAASYQTYMRCQLRHPSLETQWALQAVMVPSGGLNLSLQAPSVLDSRVTKLTQYPFQVLEPKAFDPEEEEEEEEEEEKLLCCTKCSLEFEKDVSIFKSKATQLPYWLQPHNPSHLHKDAVHELRRKWNGHCRSLRHHGHAMSLVLPPYLLSNHQWRPKNLTDTKNTTLLEPHSASLSLQLNGAGGGGGGGGSVVTPDIRITLSLGNSLLSDAATPLVEKSGATVSTRDLHDRFQENIPWQSESIPSIVEALHDDRRSCESKGGTWLLIQGTDRIGKRRLARVAAECLRGSTSKLVYIDSRSKRGIETLKEAMRKEPGSVVLIEDIDRAHGTGLTGALAKGIQNGHLKDDPFGKEVDLAHGIFILTTSNSRDVDPGNDNHPNRVLKMVIRFEDETYPNDNNNNKRRMNQEVDHVIYSDGEKNNKKQRSGDNDIELDLNVSAEESDLTHEMSMDNDNELVHRLPDQLLESIGAHNMITMDESVSGGHLMMVESFVTRLSMASGGKVSMDRAAIEGLMGAMGWFMESEFERWVKEVFESSLVTVGKLGGKLGLGIEGSEEGCESRGFLGSVLPHNIDVD